MPRVTCSHQSAPGCVTLCRLFHVCEPLFPYLELGCLLTEAGGELFTRELVMMLRRERTDAGPGQATSGHQLQIRLSFCLDSAFLELLNMCPLRSSVVKVNARTLRARWPDGVRSTNEGRTELPLREYSPASLLPWALLLTWFQTQLLLSTRLRQPLWASSLACFSCHSSPDPPDCPLLILVPPFWFSQCCLQ